MVHEPSKTPSVLALLPLLYHHVSIELFVEPGSSEHPDTVLLNTTQDIYPCVSMYEKYISSVTTGGRISQQIYRNTVR